MRRLIIVSVASFLSLAACSPSPEQLAQRAADARVAQVAAEKQAVEEARRNAAATKRAKLVGDCHGGDVVFMLPLEQGRKMIRDCERMVDSGVLAEGSRMGLDASGNMIVIAPSEVAAYQQANAPQSAPTAPPKPATGLPDSYVPTIAIDRAGEVFDALICDEVSAVGYDPQPGCEHVDQYSLWVEDMDSHGRARVRTNGEANKFVLAPRVLLNCKGTPTTLATFWSEKQQSYDFRSCD